MKSSEMDIWNAFYFLLIHRLINAAATAGTKCFSKEQTPESFLRSPINGKHDHKPPASHSGSWISTCIPNVLLFHSAFEIQYVGVDLQYIWLAEQSRRTRKSMIFILALSKILSWTDGSGWDQQFYSLRAIFFLAWVKGRDFKHSWKYCISR